MIYRILCLSGGGIRGIFQAVYLRNIATAFDKPLHECFDLIAGTSTGAIIALGLAFGVDPQKLVDLFKNDGPKIFRPRRFASIRKGPKYSQEPLRSALSSVLNVKRLGEVKRDVVVAGEIPVEKSDFYNIRTSYQKLKTRNKKYGKCW